MKEILVYDIFIVLSVLMALKWRVWPDGWRGTLLLLWFLSGLWVLPTAFDAARQDQFLSGLLAAVLLLVAVGGIVFALLWPLDGSRPRLGYRIVSWQATSTREDRGHPVDWAFDKAMEKYQARRQRSKPQH